VSSAILYVAIVVIWACVLIPRWLRRDRKLGLTHPADQAAPEDLAPAKDLAPPEDPGRPEPASARSEVNEHQEEEDMVDEPAEELAEDAPAQEDAPLPLTPEESRRRMLSARRRLLGMLIVLEAAAICLAVFNLAAMWVVIPPSLMLGGYLLILREASHADAERAAWEAEAEAHARARARARARERSARHDPGSAGWAAPVGAAAPAAPAAQYEDMGPGRDFAPGLAGKYTTSNAEIIDIAARAGDDIAHEFPDGKLRAVGD
jgi:hypothetical protein